MRVAAAAVAAAYLIALGATLFDVSGLLAVAAAAGSRCSWPASPWSWSCARGLSPEQLWAWLAERPRVSAVPTR